MTWLKIFRTRRVELRDRSARLQRNYATSTDDYEQLLDAQDGLCAICRRPSKRVLCVDHDHATGERRGLLCNSCNVGLGMFNDNIDRLKEAIRYLESYAFLSEDYAFFVEE